LEFHASTAGGVGGSRRQEEAKAKSWKAEAVVQSPWRGIESQEETFMDLAMTLIEVFGLGIAVAAIIDTWSQWKRRRS
jgi:hypothetical protein